MSSWGVAGRQSDEGLKALECFHRQIMEAGVPAKLDAVLDSVRRAGYLPAENVNRVQMAAEAPDQLLRQEYGVLVIAEALCDLHQKGVYYFYHESTDAEVLLGPAELRCSPDDLDVLMASLRAMEDPRTGILQGRWENHASRGAWQDHLEKLTDGLRELCRDLPLIREDDPEPGGTQMM